jgi:transposase
MLSLREELKVYVCTTPVDMRKSINGLSAWVVDELKQSPQSGHVFVFWNKTKDKVKLLLCDRNGFILHYKRLERSKFCFSQALPSDSFEISHEQLGWLLAGLDFLTMGQFFELDYEQYY